MGSCIGSLHQARRHTRLTQRHLRDVNLVELNMLSMSDPTARFGLFLKDVACKVVKVYDGDSLTLVWLDPGTKHIQYANCRIAGINTPEMNSRVAEEKAAAVACQRWLSSLVMDEFLAMTTVGKTGLDKYGRPLVSLRALPGASTPRLVAEMYNAELCVVMKAANLPMLRLMDERGRTVVGESV